MRLAPHAQAQAQAQPRLPCQVSLHTHPLLLTGAGAAHVLLVQALLWYTTAYMIFLLAYGGGSGTWRYGLDVQKSYSAAALIVVLLIVFIWFCMW